MLMLMTIWHTNSGATLPDSQWDWSCRTTSIFLLLVTKFMSLVNTLCHPTYLFLNAFFVRSSQIAFVCDAAHQAILRITRSKQNGGMRWCHDISKLCIFLKLPCERWVSRSHPMLVWCLDAAGQQDIEAIVREYGVNTLAFRQSCFFACYSPRNQIPIFIAFVDHQSLILF